MKKINKLRAENEELRKDRDELQALFDLQSTRMEAASALWREHNPRERYTEPDLGELLKWLADRLELFEDIGDGALDKWAKLEELLETAKRGYECAVKENVELRAARDKAVERNRAAGALLSDSERQCDELLKRIAELEAEKVAFIQGVPKAVDYEKRAAELEATLTGLQEEWGEARMRALAADGKRLRAESRVEELEARNKRVEELIWKDGCGCECMDETDDEDPSCHHDGGHGDACKVEDRCWPCRIEAALGLLTTDQSNTGLVAQLEARGVYIPDDAGSSPVGPTTTQPHAEAGTTGEEA